MNLRQKVKNAKRELVMAKRKLNEESTPYGIYVEWQNVERLKRIVDKKKKPNKHFNWNENDEVDMKKLTYVELKVNNETLYKNVSPNGKPFSHKEINLMNGYIMKRIYSHGQKIIKMDKSNDKYDYAEYYLLISDFRTKQKKLATKKLFRQFHGESTLYGLE